MEQRLICVFMLLFIHSSHAIGNSRSIIGESQTIIFENIRVERLRATLTVTELGSSRRQLTYRYSIPPRREAHQPSYAHRVFHISTTPAVLSVTIQSRRAGITKCQHRFYVEYTHYLFNHHPYVRISEDGCKIVKHTLPDDKHMMK